MLRSVLRGTAGLISLAILLGGALGFGVRKFRVAPPSHSSGYTPVRASADSIIETTVVVASLIVKSTCGVCTSPQFRSLVGVVSDSLASRTKMKGYQQRLVGIAADNNWRSGLELLEKLGGFDEVSSGGGWLNGLSYEALWEGRNSSPVVPQLILVEQRVHAGPAGMFVVSADTTGRFVGMAGIDAWVRAP